MARDKLRAKNQLENNVKTPDTKVNSQVAAKMPLEDVKNPQTADENPPASPVNPQEEEAEMEEEEDYSDTVDPQPQSPPEEEEEGLARDT